MTTMTMSSLKIAELTGKEHRNVMRDIREMFEALDFSSDLSSTMEGIYIASNGKRNPLYNLDKDLSMTLMTGYDAKARYGVVTAWRQLEEANNPSVKKLSPMELMKLALETANTELEKAHEQLAEQAPKVEGFDHFMDTSDTYTIQEACRLLGFQQKGYINHLINQRVLFRDRNDKLVPCASYRGKGWFVIKTSSYTTAWGETRSSEQTRITAFGLEEMRRKYSDR